MLPFVAGTNACDDDQPIKRKGLFGSRFQETQPRSGPTALGLWWASTEGQHGGARPPFSCLGSEREGEEEEGLESHYLLQGRTLGDLKTSQRS